MATAVYSTVQQLRTRAVTLASDSTARLEALRARLQERREWLAAQRTTVTDAAATVQTSAVAAKARAGALVKAVPKTKADALLAGAHALQYLYDVLVFVLAVLVAVVGAFYTARAAPYVPEKVSSQAATVWTATLVPALVAVDAKVAGGRVAAACEKVVVDVRAQMPEPVAEGEASWKPAAAADAGDVVEEEAAQE